MNRKICCIFNLAPHYNEPVYKLMDKELKCDFYIGDRISYPLELMNYESLNGFKKKLKYKSLIGNFYWQKGVIALAFKSYKHYILTGEPHCMSTWVILLLNRLSGRKSYLWTHGWYGDEGLLKKMIKKLFFGLSHKVLLYGDYARTLMIKEGLNPKKLLTIYNSLDYEAQIRVRQSLEDSFVYKEHFKNEYPVLLYIGRIQSRKKIELLIEALNELQKTKSFCNLLLIGKQTDETGINRLISLYSLDKYIWFYGPCYDENILGELIYNANVCVSPGNVGLTAIHSLVYGTPVISQNNFKQQMPEFEAIQPNVTGDFFIEDSVEDLYSKIIKWTSICNEERKSVRQQCYKVVDEKYNPRIQVEVIKKAINFSK
jgi:glycosyltransferase involved in cell wall biosynthesis